MISRRSIKSGAYAPTNLPLRARWFPEREMRPTEGNYTEVDMTTTHSGPPEIQGGFQFQANLVQSAAFSMRRRSRTP